MLIRQIRKLGKILRGNTTPYQIMTACILGVVLGFIPGFGQTWALSAFLVLLVILLNANLFLFALAGLFAKLVSLILLPVSFAVGKLLLDGPIAGLFSAMINAPVLAFFGFEYYLVTGTLLVGLVLGVVLGIAVIKALRKYWHRMSGLQTDSERYQQWSGLWWVRAMSWIFIGPARKDSYEDTLNKGKVGNPIRIIGLVFVVCVIALGVMVNMLFSDDIVTRLAHSGLQKANGATVNLESAEFSFTEGRLTLNGLAMADPNALDTNLFSADTLEADVSTADLLRKRWSLDRVLISGGRQGETRENPGELTQPRAEATPESGDTQGDNTGTLEDYLENAQVWKNRLAQARSWLDRLSGPVQTAGDILPGGSSGEGDASVPQRETREQRIDREIRDRGYDSVIARHLITENPRFLLRELVAEGVTSRYLPGETLNISGEYLSTNPPLAGQPPRIALRASSGKLVFDLSLASAAGLGESNALELVYNGLPGDVIGKQLNVSGQQAIAGGSIDIAIDGSVSAVDSNLPMNITLHNTTLAFPGVGQREVSNLTLPIGIRGPLDNPRITFNQQSLASVFGDAVRQEVDQRVDEEVDELEDEARDRAQDELEERAGGLLDRLGR